MRGTVGKIIEDIGTHACRSSIYTNSKKGYVPTGRITRCEKQHCVELKCVVNTNGKIQLTEGKPRVELETPTEIPPMMNNSPLGNAETHNIPGLMYTRTETNEKANLMWLAQDESNTLSGVSDGSVRDSNCQGTWAWALIRCTHDNAEPIGIDGRGREYVEGLDTQEAHSYRMEAIGLLSALHYVRKNLHWKGKLNWYMDSKSVIDTFDMCHNMRQT